MNDSVIISLAHKDGFGAEAIRLLSIAGMNHPCVEVIVKAEVPTTPAEDNSRDVLL